MKGHVSARVWGIALCTLMLASCVSNGYGGSGAAVYYNGELITMDDGQPAAQALRVENGIITHVGTTDELLALADKDTRLIDLGGKTLVPGFIDSHSHLFQYTQILVSAQLGSAESFFDIETALRDFASYSDLKPGEWIIGFGYDQNNLIEGRHPTRHELDRVSSEYPVVITHASGHMAVFNTRALEICGITADTPDPQGGFIEREAGTGEPSGYLEERAFMQYTPLIKGPDADITQLLARAENMYLSQGITTAQDSLISQKDFALISDLANRGLLRLDLILMIDLKHSAETAEANKALHNRYVNRLKIGGYKIFLDGSPQGRTAWLSSPYLPVPGSLSGTNADPSYAGYPIHTDEAVLEFVQKAAADGLSLQAHCNGDAAADQLIRVYERFLSAHPGADIHRPSLIHGQIMRKEQFSRLADMGITVSLFPAHIYYWGDVHLRNLGAERGMNISAARWAIDSGALYTVHQDSPVINPNMIETMWCMVNRVTKEGVALAADQKTTVLEALKAMTINAARAVYEEDSKGSLTPGKRADMVILSQNPLTADPADIRNIYVEQTIKDGAVLYTH